MFLRKKLCIDQVVAKEGLAELARPLPLRFREKMATPRRSIILIFIMGFSSLSLLPWNDLDIFA